MVKSSVPEALLGLRLKRAFRISSFEKDLKSLSFISLVTEGRDEFCDLVNVSRGGVLGGEEVRIVVSDNVLDLAFIRNDDVLFILHAENTVSFPFF